MRFLVDPHTHTISSGHARSTVRENALAAKQAGMEAICCTDHGPAMEGAAAGFIVTVLSHGPEYIEGVRVVNGTEANILDYAGKLDISDRYLGHTDFAIASMHDGIVVPGSKAEHTEAVLGALGNPYIDVIGHPGNPHFELDIEAVVGEAKRRDKLIEINNNSFIYRKGSQPNCLEFLRLCRQKDVRVTVSSDAHICYKIGRFEHAVRILEESGFPEELVVSRSLEVFDGYLRERKTRIHGLCKRGQAGEDGK
ncbi:phosphatase [Christensenella intestinihominis]|uniref:phosphatase n=1 Tax=Christensenella intestinihominis TaxID=1851429 RepID=UPI00082D8A43|nr:phosphatase [Christensenella intestinihominis]